MISAFAQSARRLRRRPALAATAVVTLALAIGANTAIFSLVNALLLQALPYADPQRIGTLYARTSGPQASDTRRTIDGEQWERLRDDVSSLVSAVSAMRTSGTNVRAGVGTQYLQARPGISTSLVSVPRWGVLSRRTKIARKVPGQSS